MRTKLKSAFCLFSLALTSYSSAQSISPNVADGHLLTTRWSESATNGTGLVQGQPTTLTWGFVADGTSVFGAAPEFGEVTSPSNMIITLDTIIGSGLGGTDYTNRPWFNNFASPFTRFSELSGLSYVYVTYDDGVQLTSDPGQLNVRPDIRIGGHSIDGQSGGDILAYNYFPNSGEMVIDTDNTDFYANANNNYLGFRNTIAHEAGHGLGIDHLLSSTNSFLMEPFIDTSFDGPQHSDILAIHRGYGDVYEKNGGNDTSSTASSLGSASSFTGIGFDADNIAVAPTDIDFASIDGLTDTDFYSISLDQDGEFDIILTSLGLAYDIKTQSSPDPFTSVDTSALNNLALTLFGIDGTTEIASSNTAAAGGSESILGQMLTAGTYFLRVSGSDDRAQFYSLTANFTAIPEPTASLLLAFSCLAVITRRKRH